MDADVAELADATDLGSVARWGVEVQVLSSAHLTGDIAGPARGDRSEAIWARSLAGKRLLCTQETAGSNPAGSTRRCGEEGRIGGQREGGSLPFFISKEERGYGRSLASYGIVRRIGAG